MNTTEQKRLEKIQKDWAEKHPRTWADFWQDAWMFLGASVIWAILIYHLCQFMLRIAR